jgi:hypothetical protein
MRRESIGTALKSFILASTTVDYILFTSTHRRPKRYGKLDILSSINIRGGKEM